MKIFFFLFGLALISFESRAQEKNNAYPKDSLVKAQIIDPFEQAAINNNQTPEWAVLQTQIAAKYNSAYAAKMVNKAEIFYYYGKDKPAFTAALVSYTEKYEDHNDLALLNKNAAMVARLSVDKQELQTAQSWSKHTLDKDPGNADYQKTFDALTQKLKSQ